MRLKEALDLYLRCAKVTTNATVAGECDKEAGELIGLMQKREATYPFEVVAPYCEEFFFRDLDEANKAVRKYCRNSPYGPRR